MRDRPVSNKFVSNSFITNRFFFVSFLYKNKNELSPQKVTKHQYNKKEAHIFLDPSANKGLFI